ncbi:TIGR00366 family protein [Halomicrococcus sp. SG-WS-1]|uniref:TIGR00366 family protein n=1 Tax=Halomicrococcus sp. SG-WS-1 TaxID=3439057 RepID=UPI003F799319
MATDHQSDADREPSGFVPHLGAYYPESLALAVVLGVLALLATTPRLDALVQLELFSTGFTRVLSVQMALVLWWVLSATVVESRPVGAAFDRLAARVPTSQRAIVAGTALLALVFGWVNWALGFVGAVLVGQSLCRHAADRGVDVHYPLVLVAALLSLVTATLGVTSPGALVMADPSGTINVLLDGAGVVPLGTVVFHPANLFVVGVLVVTLPPALAALAPDEDVTPVDESDLVVESSVRETLDHYAPDIDGEPVPADRLEQSTWLTAVVGAIGVVSIAWQWALGAHRAMLGVLFALLVVGLLVQRRPLAFVEKVSDSTRWVEHLLVPFLLYGSVYALLTESGLAGAVGDALASTGFPRIASYAVALVLGVFVPDPGSLWLLLGPSAAATAANVDGLVVAVMAGAGVSNVWLSFLFLGVLGVRGFDWRTFLRYAVGLTVYVSAVVAAAFLLF